MTLTEFLLARIAEDEDRARSCVGPTWGSRPYGFGVFQTDEPFTDLFESKQAGRSECQHVRSWDPARVLAECEAKRRIVTETEGYDFAVLDAILMYLAHPYANHPDYQQEWAL